MPDFEITSPDGQRFIVTAPEGATQDEVLRYAQQNMPRQPAAQPQAPATPAPGAMGPFQPNTTGNAVATGLGDPFRGLEQNVARIQQGNTDSRLMRMLQGNPNIAAAMDTTGPGRMRTPAEVDASIAAREQDYQGRRAAAGETGTDWGRMSGQVLSTAPAALALPAGSSLLGSIGAGAMSGAALNALQPVTSGNFADEKKQQVEMGALLGAATGPIGLALGRALSPRVAPEVRALSDAGVQLTPGQMVGGMARRVEDAVGSFPGVGESVRQAQRASVDSLNTAVANRALREIGQTVPDGIPAGYDLTAHVGQAIQRHYTDALAAARPFNFDRQFTTDLADVAKMFMTPSARAEFLQIVRDNVLSRAAGGVIEPGTYQIIRSELGRAAREAAGPTASLAQREQARAFGKLQEAFDELFKRSNPAQAPAVDAANAAWAVLARMETAGAQQGAKDGVFTPAMLERAVRNADRSVRRRDYARGDALLQDLSGPAASVLPARVSDSGTPERLATMGLLSGAGIQSLFGLSLPQMAGLGAAYAAYTPPAQRAIQTAIMAPRGAGLRATGDAIAQSGGAVTVPLGGLLFAPPPPQFLEQRR